MSRHASPCGGFLVQALLLFEIATVLVRPDHVASVIVNANHGIMRLAIMFCVSDCIRGSFGAAISQATEWQRIRDQIDTAFVFARADFVNVDR